MERKLRFFDAGEKGLLVQWPEIIDPSINREIWGLLFLLEKECLTGLLETIPAYSTILIEYDPYMLSRSALKERILSLYRSLGKIDLPLPSVYLLPTCYGGEYGPDLPWVAEYTGFTEEEVIKIHSQRDYLIYMLGFSPGFPYLGGMDNRIAVPRLKKPRSKIPSGSVAIASKQTGVYPLPTPGGWRIIGRTPLQLFQAKRKDPVFFKAGNYLRFYSINEREFHQISLQVKKGEYSVPIFLAREEDSF